MLAAPSAMRAAPVLKRAHSRVAVRGPLGKERDRATAAELLPDLLERLAILRRVGAVHAAVDRNRSHGAREHADDRHPEERFLGQEDHAARCERQHQQRIDQRIGMVETEHHRAGCAERARLR